jgi:hypothetical protein
VHATRRGCRRWHRPSIQSFSTMTSTFLRWRSWHAPIDAVNQHRQLRRGQSYRLAWLDAWRPAETRATISIRPSTIPSRRNGSKTCQTSICAETSRHRARDRSESVGEGVASPFVMPRDIKAVACATIRLNCQSQRVRWTIGCVWLSLGSRYALSQS